jgi:demethylmenaquinone methyltransferase/2-methoxy-6-polyprenyl-1,4-benzoquinol methylase
VLDAGAGVGVDAIAVAPEVVPGGAVVGVDFSQAMVEEATRRAAGLDLPISFVQGDLHALDFPDVSFDAATLSAPSSTSPTRALRRPSCCASRGRAG